MEQRWQLVRAYGIRCTQLMPLGSEDAHWCGIGGNAYFLDCLRFQFEHVVHR